MSSSGSLSHLVQAEIENLRRNEGAGERRDTVRQLEARLAVLRGLEELGERILAAVVADRATEAQDSLEIPSFLRRY